MATTEVKTASYGTWTSPITADLIAKKGVSFSDVLVDPVTKGVYHLESRPSEGGRIVVVDSKTGKDVFGEGWNARTGVQEYGGAAAIVYNGNVFFSNFADGRIYKTNGSEKPVAVTAESKVNRFANFTPHPKYPNILLSILEDHTNPTPSQVVTTLVSIDTKTSTISKFVSGTDFYAAPAFNADGSRVAWIQWAHPDMPWEGAEVHVASVKVDGNKLVAENDTKIAGVKGQVSAIQPEWTSDGSLIFTSDISGFINPWIATFASSSSNEFTAKAILKEPVEQDFGEPGWILGDSAYAILGETTFIAAAFKAGRSVLYIVDWKTGKTEFVDSPYVHITAIRGVSKEEVVFIGEQATKPKSIIRATINGPDNIKFEDAVAPKEDDDKIPEDYFSPPIPLSFEVSPGEPLHVVFYEPKNPEFRGPENERPPCVFSIHGGPTSMATQGLSLRRQYFTSRGFAWTEVNYGGSSGYGRKYIDRLVGKWGITDVADAVQSVLELSRRQSGGSAGRIDGERSAITGGSAGGYTTLASLACPPNGIPNTVFGAGASSYGVSDLRKLAEFTHKFESRYLEKLIGGTPEAIPQVYKERSPVFHAENVKVPLLILQGADDAVVPPQQAEDMVKVIKEHGGRVDYVLFEGEGHGWRKAETIIKALETELAFYRDVFKLKPL